MDLALQFRRSGCTSQSQSRRPEASGACACLSATWRDAPIMRAVFCDLHHVEFLVLIELALLLSGGILVLLVLGHEVVHVGLSLGELHLVHALTSVPVKECLAAEHSSELL